MLPLLQWYRVLACRDSHQCQADKRGHYPSSKDLLRAVNEIRLLDIRGMPLLNNTFPDLELVFQINRHQIVIDNNIGTHDVYILSEYTHCQGDKESVGR